MSLQSLSIAFGKTEARATILDSKRIKALVSAINAGITQNNGMSLLSGYIASSEGSISESYEYVLKKAGITFVGTVRQESYAINLSLSTIGEGQQTHLSFTNKTNGESVPLSSMRIKMTHAIKRDSYEVSDDDIKSYITINENGIISVARPTKNWGWSDAITIDAFPASMDNDDYTDEERLARTVSTVLNVKAVAVNSIEVIPNDQSYSEGVGGYSFSVKLLPTTNTKEAYAGNIGTTWRAEYGLFSGGYYTAPIGKSSDRIYCNVNIFGSSITNELSPYSLIIETILLSSSKNPLVWNAVKTALSLPATVESWTTSDCAKVTNEQFLLILEKMYDISTPFSFECGEAFTGVTAIISTSSKHKFSSVVSNVSLPKLGSVTYNDTTSGLFYNCNNIDSINLPSLRTIHFTGHYGRMFNNCSSLVELNLPSLVSMTHSQINGGDHIDSPFMGCSSLKKVTMPSLTSYEPYHTDARNTRYIGLFYKLPLLEYVDLSSLSNIRARPPQSTQSDNSPTGDCLFYGCTSLKTVKLDNLQSITVEVKYNTAPEVNTFSGCTSLKSISLPSLSSITIKEDTTNYNYTGYTQSGSINMFAGCTSLTDVDMPKLNTIEMLLRGNAILTMFNGCTGLKNINLPSLSRINIRAIKGSIVNQMFKGTSVNTIRLNLLTELNYDIAPTTFQEFCDNSYLNNIEISRESNGSALSGIGTFYNCSSLGEETYTLDQSEDNIIKYGIGNNPLVEQPFFGANLLSKLILSKTTQVIGNARNSKGFLYGSEIKLIDSRKAKNISNYGSMFLDYEGRDKLVYVHSTQLRPPLIEGFGASTAPIFVPSGSWNAYRTATGWKDIYNEEGYSIIASVFAEHPNDVTKNLWERRGDTSYADAKPSETITQEQITASKINKNRLFPDTMLPWFVKSIYGLDFPSWVKDKDNITDVTADDMDDIDGITLSQLV